MATQNADVLVLGCGVAGQKVAYAMRDAGRSVTMFEPVVPGGTCPTRGCDAKKPFVNAASRLRAFQSMTGHGLSGEARIDWPALMAFKRSFTRPIPGRTRDDLKGAGVELVEHRPRFVDAHTIEAGGQRWRGEQVVIASGLRPRTPELPGGGLEHAIDSDAFLELDELPRRIVFIGGGYIAMEFACVAAAAGSEVTVLQATQYPLAAFDEDVVRTVMAAMHDQGITVLTHRKVTAVERAGGGGALRVHTDADESYEADLVINASGRVPAIDGMGLDDVGIAHGEDGITVDEHLRSVSHPHIWAAGDVADNGRPPLTPTAGQDGGVVVHNLLQAERHQALKTAADTPVASVVFTVPPIGAVGLTEAQARERHDNIRVDAGSLAEKKFYRQMREHHASYKFIFDQDDNLIGAHLAGHGCDEVINIFAQSIGQGCTRNQLCATTLAYPTIGISLQGIFKTQQKDG